MGRPVFVFFEGFAKVMFKYTEMVMSLTPLGVFGAMAYNVSHMAARHMHQGHVVEGWPAVLSLLGRYARLVGSLYLSLALLFVLVFVLLAVAGGLVANGFGERMYFVAAGAVLAGADEEAGQIAAGLPPCYTPAGIPFRTPNGVPCP